MNDKVYIPDELWKHILEYALPQTTLGDLSIDNVELPNEEGNHTYRDKILKFSHIALPPSYLDDSYYGIVGATYYCERAYFVMYKSYIRIILKEFNKHSEVSSSDLLDLLDPN